MTTNTPKITITVEFWPNYDKRASQFEPLQTLLSSLAQQDVPVNVQLEDTTPAPASAEPKRARGRPRTDANISLPVTPTAPPSPSVTVASGNGSDDLMLPPGGAPADDKDDGDDDDMFGLPPAGRTGEEAKELALGGLRNLINAGHKDPVKAIQKSFGVARFSDIEARDGHKLLRAVEDASQKAGMRI